MTLQACVDDLLRRGIGDWIQASELAWVVMYTCGAATDAEIQAMSVDLVREVLQQGLMKIGDVTRDGFREWNVPVSEAVSRVEREWAALGRSPNLGEIFWLENTEKGDQRAQQLLDSGGSSR